MPGPTPPAIAVFGSVNADVSGFCDHLPRPGETALGTRYSIALGGKGANQAAAVARLAYPVEMIGRVGDDSFGAMVRTSLEAFGVLHDHLLMTKGTGAHNFPASRRRRTKGGARPGARDRPDS
jgi:ribokinase